MEGGAEQAKRFKRSNIQSSSNPGHQIKWNKAGNQKKAGAQNGKPVPR